MFALGILLLAPAYADDCLAVAHGADVAQKLTAGEAALQAADAPGFSSSLEETALLVPCLGDVLAPPVAAQLHRLYGIEAWVAGDTARAKDDFQAARVLDPAYRFPDALFSADHEIRKAYEGLDPARAAANRVATPKSGHLAFDGTISHLRPADRSTVAQFVDPADHVTQTLYLLPDQPLPAYAVVPRKRNALIVTALGAAAGSAALYGASWATHNAFMSDDPSYTLEDLQSLRGTTTGLLVGSGVLGAAAVGSGLGAAFIGPR